MRATTAVLASIFPLRCAGCGVAAEPVCSECADTLRLPDPAAPPRGVDHWVAAFAYEGVAADLIARVKYRAMRAVIPWLADAIVDALVGEPGTTAVDVVTWAPTTAARRRARGFDHGALLGRAVARRLDRPGRALLRREPGPPQTGSPARARSAVRFAARASPPRALVVDDVATTGATLTAAALALRAQGAAEVFAATAGRTPTSAWDPPISGVARPPWSGRGE